MAAQPGQALGEGLGRNQIRGGDRDMTFAQPAGDIRDEPLAGRFGTVVPYVVVVARRGHTRLIARERVEASVGIRDEVVADAVALRGRGYRGPLRQIIAFGGE
ncbi:Uncharacterised protein [Mycobacteroides abscessus subsp. massiliense]|nr:Uncharacterised protein [Mycobacteroides abscessus subsp. massiliense]